MSNFFNVIKGLVFGTNQNNTQENQVIEHYNEPETQGICARCHKTVKLKKYGLCDECFNARRELVNAANPEIYNQFGDDISKEFKSDKSTLIFKSVA